jgi:hypothetical protein
LFIEYPHKFNKARSKVQSNSQRIGANGQMPEGKTATLLLFKLSSKFQSLNWKILKIILQRKVKGDTTYQIGRKIF